VLSQTYGAFADLRRELSDSKATVNGREDILEFRDVPGFAAFRGCCSRIFRKNCPLAPRFPPRYALVAGLLNAQGKAAWRNSRSYSPCQSVPCAQLQAHASLDRFPGPRKPRGAISSRTETGSRPTGTAAARHCRAPRACRLPRAPDDEDVALPPGRAISLFAPRTGEKARTLRS